MSVACGLCTVDPAPNHDSCSIQSSVRRAAGVGGLGWERCGWLVFRRLPPSRYADFYHLHYFGKEGSSEQRGYIQEKKLIKQPGALESGKVSSFFIYVVYYATLA